MANFEEMTRLKEFKAEIKAGNRQYKDFYVFFKQQLLKKFDDAVAGMIDD